MYNNFCHKIPLVYIFVPHEKKKKDRIFGVESSVFQINSIGETVEFRARL